MSHAENRKNLPQPVPSIDTPEGIIAVVRRAAKGEDAMRPLVNELLDRDNEQGLELMSFFGDVFGDVQRRLIKLAAGDNIVAQEAIRRQIDAVRDELAGPNPSPLERILCERVALSWFDSHEMDRRFSNQSGIPFQDAEYRESRRDRAHKRFLSACRTLATVRKLALPAIQVNVARQQVNVAGST